MNNTIFCFEYLSYMIFFAMLLWYIGNVWYLRSKWPKFDSLDHWLEKCPSHFYTSLFMGMQEGYKFQINNYLIQFCRFNPEERPPVKSTYPKPISNWEGIPDNIDDALKYKNGFTYFFKNGQYWRFDDRAFKVRWLQIPFYIYIIMSGGLWSFLGYQISRK